MQGDLILIDSWVDIGLNRSRTRGTEKMKCPECSATRSNKSDKSLSVVYAMGYAKCHYCNTRYKVKDQKSTYEHRKEYKLPTFDQLELSESSMNFFKSRGIDESGLKRYRVSDANEWMPGKDGEHNGKKFSIKAGICPAIAFNYYFEGEHVNTKFRASQKRFKMISGAKLVFYGIDHVKKETWCAIQEGEIDTMTAYQCGIKNSISVPNGASIGSQTLEYLDNCIDYFENKTKIIIAADGDSAGRALSAELIRRLGAERCWTIEYPEGCKDTNEVLLKYGKQAVKDMYDNASQVPIEGIASADEVSSSFFDLYDNGYPPTCKIGYPNFDQLLSFKPGELTTLTGIPSMGKSTFLDQVTVKLAARFDWKTVYFSPENELPVHTGNLIKKLTGKPTFGPERLSREHASEALKFIHDHFYFMQYNEMNTDVDGILAKTREMVSRKGINALVIDPWNCIDHQLPRGMNEGQYVSTVLSKLTSFAKINQIHIFLVAHPTKMDQDPKTGKYVAPTLYKISGSAHFFNKTYNGVTVHVDFEAEIVDVHVQKVKFEYVGHKGVAQFTYDMKTGRYREIGSSAVMDIEYDIWLKRMRDKEIQESHGEQASITFHPEAKVHPPEEEEKPSREPGQLTDINKLMPNGYEPPF